MTAEALAPVRLLQCDDCDLLHRVRPVAEGSRAKCGRCGALLISRTRDSLHRATAWYLAALVLWCVANGLPFLTFELEGRRQPSLLISGPMQDASMARPKEFDVDAAFAIAQTLFWEKGFDATSTEDLRLAMGIGRQSFYDTFGGKRDVFLATLRRYVDERFDDTMRVLSGAPSPLGGVERLLQSVAEESPEKRARGCFGVSTMCALGASDEDVRRVGEAATKRLVDALAAALVRAKESGEVDPGLHEREAAAHLHATLVGSRVLAKGGARPEMLRSIATSAVAALRPRAPKRR